LQKDLKFSNFSTATCYYHFKKGTDKYDDEPYDDSKSACYFLKRFHAYASETETPIALSGQDNTHFSISVSCQLIFLNPHISSGILFLNVKIYRGIKAYTLSAPADRNLEQSQWVTTFFVIVLTLPFGESLVAGYINMPPYFNVL
jgi:hypothetical protein